MKNLTIKSTIENTINAVSKYCQTTMGNGKNVFFYLPSIFCTYDHDWAVDDFDNYYPLDRKVMNNKKYRGYLSVTLKLSNSDNSKEIQTVVLDKIPLGSGFYNQSYLMPMEVYKNGHYYGIGMRFPTLIQRANLEINEKWHLLKLNSNHEFQWERQLVLPIVPDSTVNIHDLQITKDNTDYFRKLITYNNQNYQEAVKDAFAPIRNYNYQDFDADASFSDFGEQSICIGLSPRLETLWVEKDAQQIEQLHVYNQQPRFDSKIAPFDDEELQATVVKEMLNREIIGTSFGNILKSANSMSQWYTAAYNLCNQSGTQFIKIDGVSHNSMLDVKFPEFHVTEF